MSWGLEVWNQEASVVGFFWSFQGKLFPAFRCFQEFLESFGLQQWQLSLCPCLHSWSDLYIPAVSVYLPSFLSLLKIAVIGLAVCRKILEHLILTSTTKLQGVHPLSFAIDALLHSQLQHHSPSSHAYFGFLFACLLASLLVSIKNYFI